MDQKRSPLSIPAVLTIANVSMDWQNFSTLPFIYYLASLIANYHLRITESLPRLMA